MSVFGLVKASISTGVRLRPVAVSAGQPANPGLLLFPIRPFWAHCKKKCIRLDGSSSRRLVRVSLRVAGTGFGRLRSERLFGRFVQGRPKSRAICCRRLQPRALAALLPPGEEPDGRRVPERSGRPADRQLQGPKPALRRQCLRCLRTIIKVHEGVHCMSLRGRLAATTWAVALAVMVTSAYAPLAREAGTAPPSQ